MSFPVLQSAKSYALVQVRIGRGATGWSGLNPLYEGPCCADQKWQGDEGEKLAVRHCMWPDDPDSTLSQPYIVAGTEGQLVGHPELLRFPRGV